MRKFITIDQECVMAWQINYQEAVLFSWMYSLPSWASQVFVDGKTFYFAAHSKACADLPGLTEKEDTMYRYYKRLEKSGLIEITMINQKAYVRLTEKGKLWNQLHGSEKNPTIGQSSELGSEEHPEEVGQSSDHIDSNIESNIIDNYPYNPQNKISTPPALRPGVKFFKDFLIPKDINSKILDNLNDLIQKDYSYDMRMMEQAFEQKHYIEFQKTAKDKPTKIQILPVSMITDDMVERTVKEANRLAELEVPIYKNYITYLKLYLKNDKTN